MPQHLTMSELIRQTLGPDAQIGIWNHQIMPYDAARERWLVATNTWLWWVEAHQQDTPYHRQFRGYCPRCSEG